MSSLSLAYELTVHQIGPITVARLLPPPRLAAGTERAVGEYLQRLLKKRDVLQLVLNLSKVPYLDTPLVGELLILQGNLRALKGCLLLCGLSPQVCAAFKPLNVARFFTIFEREADAVRALAFANSWLLGRDTLWRLEEEALAEDDCETEGGAARSPVVCLAGA